MSKVLLLIPPYSIPPEYPLCGLGAISESLAAAHVEHVVLDLRLKPDPDLALDEAIARHRPEWLGVTFMTQNYRTNYRRLERIRHLHPGIKVVVGGPHLSTLREEVLTDCAAIDFGVILEGEESFVRLVQGDDARTIPGLLYRCNGDVCRSESRKFIDDLDRLGWPKYSRFDLDAYHSDVICIVTSRGCPQTCIFCPVKRAIGARLRLRSVESILEEVEYWYGRGRRRFNIQDDNFTYDAERIFCLCNEIRNRGLHEHVRFALPNAVRADKVDRDMLTELRRSGFFQIAFGVEAGNDRILGNLKKGEDMETIDRSVREAVELGFDVGLFFLVGSPGETVADVEDSIAFAEKYAVKSAIFYNLIPYPKTPLMLWVRRNGRFLVDPEDYLNDLPQFSAEPVFETDDFRGAERRRMLQVTAEVSRRIWRKSVRRELKRRFGAAGLALSLLFASGFGAWMMENISIIRKIRDRRHLT